VQQLLTGEFNLPGYNIFTHGLDDPTKRGLLLYISVDIEASLVDVPSAIRECLFVLLKNRRKTNSLLVGNIYRSPNSSEENDINLHQLFKYIDQNYKFSKLIIGDFNFPNIHWYPVQTGASARCSGLSDKEMKFVNTLGENSLLQHVVSPTRQRGSDAPHILDLVIFSANFVSDIVHLSPLGNSNHCVLHFNCYCHIEQAKSADKFMWDKGDYDKLRDFLNINWDDVLDPLKDSVDEMWEHFKSTVTEGMSKFIPVRAQHAVNRKRNFQPFTADLQRLVRRKHRLWNSWVRIKRDAVFTEYKQIRNQVKRTMVDLLQQE